MGLKRLSQRLSPEPDEPEKAKESAGRLSPQADEPKKAKESACRKAEAKG